MSELKKVFPRVEEIRLDLEQWKIKVQQIQFSLDQFKLGNNPRFGISKKPEINQSRKTIGRLEKAIWHEGILELEGQVSSFTAPVENFKVYIGNQRFFKFELNIGLDSPGFQRVYPDLVNAQNSGFKIKLSLTQAEYNQFKDFIITLIPIVQGKEGHILLSVLEPSIPLPKLELLKACSSNPQAFMDVSCEFLSYFIEMADLKPDNSVLDIGCGVGRIAYSLGYYLSPVGRYEGFDIVDETLQEAKRVITTHKPNFNFQKVDLYNQAYNPNGTLQAINFAFPYADESFDLVYLTSIFTHLMPVEVRHYLSEIHRVLKPGGRCLLTCFLLNDESQKLIAEGKTTQRLVYRYEEYFTKNPKIPEAAIGFKEHLFLDWIAHKEFNIIGKHYGYWCSRPRYTSYQDIVVIEKKKLGNNTGQATKPDIHLKSLLLDRSDLMALKARSNDYPFKQILENLQTNSKIAKTMGVEGLLKIPASSSLFIIHNTILELGLLYKIVDDDQAGQLAKTLVMQMSLSDENLKNLFAEEIHTAFILTAIIFFVYDLAPELFSPQEKATVLDFIKQKTESLWQESRTQAWGRREFKRNAWNHTAIAFCGLAIGAISLRDYHSPAQGWLEVAISRVEDFLINGITDAGLTREGLWYCGFVSKILGFLLRICRRNHIKVQGEFLDDKYSQKLDKLIKGYIYEVFPQGKYLNNWNDSYWDPHPALWGYLTLGANRNPELVTYVWEKLVGQNGLVTYGSSSHLVYSSLFDAYLFIPYPVPQAFQPETANFSPRNFCPEIGYLNTRDTWSENATVVTFSCGEYIGAIHDQSDNNSFTLTFQGQPLVIDSGAANSSQENSASSSLGHNLVLIDGKGQRFSGGGHGVSGKIIRTEFTETFDYIVGDATSAYNLMDYNPVHFAVRHLCFVKQPFPYFITFDDIQKSEKIFSYEYILHVPRDYQISEIHSNKFKLTTNNNSQSHAFILWFLNPKPIILKPDKFSSKGQTPFSEHQLLRFELQAVNPQFVALFISENDFKQMNVDVQANFEESEVSVELSSLHQKDRLEFAFYSLFSSEPEKLFNWKRNSR
jgi:ubiquinone/menaquinone biosynthesis C-methylase UbiE